MGNPRVYIFRLTCTHGTALLLGLVPASGLWLITCQQSAPSAPPAGKKQERLATAAVCHTGAQILRILTAVRCTADLAQVWYHIGPVSIHGSVTSV